MWLMAAADLNRFTAVDGDGSNMADGNERPTVVTLMTWVAPESLSKWAAPSEPSDAVYRAQHLHLY